MITIRPSCSYSDLVQPYLHRNPPSLMPRQYRTCYSSTHQHAPSQSCYCPASLPSTVQPGLQSVAPIPIYSLEPSASCELFRWLANTSLLSAHYIKIPLPHMKLKGRTYTILRAHIPIPEHLLLHTQVLLMNSRRSSFRFPISPVSLDLRICDLACLDLLGTSLLLNLNTLNFCLGLFCDRSFGGCVTDIDVFGRRGRGKRRSEFPFGGSGLGDFGGAEGESLLGAFCCWTA